MGISMHNFVAGITRLAAVLALVLSLGVLSAQNDRVVIQREGQSFFVHTVEQGHTLYSISKLYQTTVDDIEAANPGVGAGIGIGQSLYIPVPDSHNPKEWTNPVRLENGLMIHKVKKKETLYGICREYTVDINRLLELNPDAERGIHQGMELRIPSNDLHESATLLPQPATPDETAVTAAEPEKKKQEKAMLVHVVEPGETLYGICRKYGIDQDALLNANGGLQGGLRAGEEIFLPTETGSPSLAEIKQAAQSAPSQTPAVIMDLSAQGNSYNVVIMLPFVLDLNLEEGQRTPASIERLREIAMQMYRGSIMALDTLEAQGARLNVTVLDVHNDSNLDAVLRHSAVRQAHLIIGPMQRKPLDHVSAFAAKENIHVVCPVPQSNNVLLGKPTLSKAVPSADSQIKAMAHHVFDHHRGENIILINSKEASDVRLVQMFKQTYLDRLRTIGDTSLTGIAEIEGSGKFVGDLQNRLSKGRRNIIVVPAGSQSKSMIANLQTKIQLLARDHDIIIFGLNEWSGYEFLDVAFKERTHMVLPSPTYTDYNHSAVVDFIETYRARFDVVASEYALIGHDLMLFYGRGMMLYGAGFQSALGSMPNHGLLHLKFRYRKTGIDSGFENEHVFMLQHQNYYLDPIGHARTQ